MLNPQQMLPTLQQVHALMPQRPQFTDTSVPTAAEVTDLILFTSQAVTGEGFGELPEHLAGKVQYIVALGTASTIESSYYPEQNDNDGSPSATLYTRYQAELLGLRALLSTATAGNIAFSMRMGT